jgi:hypothetical protein
MRAATLGGSQLVLPSQLGQAAGQHLIVASEGRDQVSARRDDSAVMPSTTEQAGWWRSQLRPKSRPK